MGILSAFVEAVHCQVKKAHVSSGYKYQAFLLTRRTNCHLIKLLPFIFFSPTSFNPLEQVFYSHFPSIITMQSLTILVLALVGVSTASIAVEDITYEHFASHDANLATFGVDLTSWGYQGGQLPKHYAISGNGSFNYIPTDSYTIFQSIISGQRNRSSSTDTDAVLLDELATRDVEIEKRCETMDFDLYGFQNGGACTTTFYSSCIDPGACYYGNGCGSWNSIDMCKSTSF